MRFQMLLLSLTAIATLSVHVGSSAADPLPLNDGRYVTEQAFCQLSENEMVDRFGDGAGAYQRMIDGPVIRNGYEMYCTVLRVLTAPPDVAFRAECGAEGYVERITGRYQVRSADAFALGDRTFTRCR